MSRSKTGCSLQAGVLDSYTAGRQRPWGTLRGANRWRSYTHASPTARCDSAEPEPRQKQIKRVGARTARPRLAHSGFLNHITAGQRRSRAVSLVCMVSIVVAGAQGGAVWCVFPPVPFNHLQALGWPDPTIAPKRTPAPVGGHPHKPRAAVRCKVQ